MVIRKSKVYNGIPVNCKRCGELIGFHKKINGSFMPVDLFTIADSEEYYYLTRMGNYQNLTPRHNCEKFLEDQKELQEAEERRQNERLEALKTLRELRKGLSEEEAKNPPDPQILWAYKVGIKQTEWVEKIQS